MLLNKGVLPALIISCCLLLSSNWRLDAQSNEILIDEFMISIQNLPRDEQINQLFLQANEALLMEDPKLAIAFAESARSLAPNLPQVNASADSIIRLAQAQLNANVTNTEVNWSTDNNITDRNRYLLLFSLFMDNYGLTWAKNPRYARAGVGLNLEGFLPVLNRQFGFGLRASSQFLDFNQPSFSHDFTIMRYDAFFIWRTTWRIPAVEISTTVALKFGVAGLYYIKQRDFNQVREELPKSYILPKFEIHLQDALLGRFLPNPFTQNLYLNITLGVEWLPFHKTRESIAFDAMIGLFYAMGSLSIGPAYQFRFQRMISDNQNLISNRWSLFINYML